jgi:hypothetical protein
MESKINQKANYPLTNYPLSTTALSFPTNL